MDKILARMETIHWKLALREVIPDEPVRTHLLSSTGADFLFGMPWDEIETILEVGSGMGFMTAPLASLARQVVAVEAVPERALFQAKRAAQDGFFNWHPLIASGTALPFAPESFDLIALNGVFEYIGLWGEDDPLKLQQDFLAQAFRLLRPNGYLYIGIETRYALSSWLGGHDHTGLAFTSLMPRRLADWYCRIRSVPFYGSETVANGYRTYTHSPRRYVSLFKEAGFQSVETYGCFDGYNRQIALYPLADYPARLTTRRLVTPPASRLGWLRRQVADSRFLHDKVENEVVIFGRKTAKQGRLAWSTLPVTGTVTQFNTHGKTFALSFEDGKPTSLFKRGKTAFAQQQIESEFKFLQKLHQEFGAEAEQMPLQWPQPVDRHLCHKHFVFQYEYVDGRSLATELLPLFHDTSRFVRSFTQLVTGYIELTEKLSAKQTGSADRTEATEYLARFESVNCPEPRLKERIQTACQILRTRPWPRRVMHGDLTLSNTILVAEGRMMLIDWENACDAGFVVLDLLRLLFDTWVDSHMLEPVVREQVMEHARRTICSVLPAVGVQPPDFRHAESLFFAQQLAFADSWEVSTGKLIEAYREDILSLASVS